MDDANNNTLVYYFNGTEQWLAITQNRQNNFPVAGDKTV